MTERRPMQGCHGMSGYEDKSPIFFNASTQLSLKNAGECPCFREKTDTRQSYVETTSVGEIACSTVEEFLKTLTPPAMVTL